MCLPYFTARPDGDDGGQRAQESLSDTIYEIVRIAARRGVVKTTDEHKRGISTRTLNSRYGARTRIPSTIFG